MKLLKALTYGGWPILVLPYAVGFLGGMMNEAVVWANHLRMPVVVDGCSALLANNPDFVHQCMTAHTHLKWLGDIFISDGGVSSIGDAVIEFSAVLQSYALYVWVGALAYATLTKKQFFLE